MSIFARLGLLMNISLTIVPTPAMSVGVGRIFESVCLLVCLFVRTPEHNSKTSDPIVFKLGIENDLGYPRSGTVLGLKCQKSRSQGQ